MPTKNAFRVADVGKITWIKLSWHPKNGFTCVITKPGAAAQFCSLSFSFPCCCSYVAPRGFSVPFPLAWSMLTTNQRVRKECERVHCWSCSEHFTMNWLNGISLVIDFSYIRWIYLNKMTECKLDIIRECRRMPCKVFHDKIIKMIFTTLNQWNGMKFDALNLRRCTLQ